MRSGWQGLAMQTTRIACMAGRTGCAMQAVNHPHPSDLHGKTLALLITPLDYPKAHAPAGDQSPSPPTALVGLWGPLPDVYMVQWCMQSALCSLHTALLRAWPRYAAQKPPSAATIRCNQLHAGRTQNIAV